jgi:predicted DCC family thiol-disulfide oxidoreductase YuxK
MDDKLLLIYDGDCRFCRFGMEVVRTLDLMRALDFCPFGNPVAEERLAVIPPDERYTSFHAATESDLFSGTEAARKTLEALPFGRIATAFGLHNAYPLLARSRSVLGRFVPDRLAVITCGDAPDPHHNGKLTAAAGPVSAR